MIFVRAVAAAVEERWATSGNGPMRRDPGEPGLRLRRRPAPGARAHGAGPGARAVRPDATSAGCGTRRSRGPRRGSRRPS
ncbi:DUF6207 family protein [Streptomyces gardneri]|uniref:DUF6207 family protein n=1 Tax=Streptomyces gardneri TaxID=66892 RepID=UPI0035D54E3A